MNFYEAVVRFKQLIIDEEKEVRSLFAVEGARNPNSVIMEVFSEFNRSLGVRCDNEGAYSIFFWEAEKGKGKIIFSVDTDLSNIGAILYF